MLYPMLYQFFLRMNAGPGGADGLATASVLLCILLIACLLYWVAKAVFLRIVERMLLRKQSVWHASLVKNEVFGRLIRILPALVLHFLAPALPAWQLWLQRIAFCLLVLAVMSLLDRLIDCVDEIYRTRKAAAARPIKGYLQVLKIIIYAVGVVIIVSALMDRSPLLLLSGIGAATAVLLLVFQNTILGFVAGIQLTENNMVRLGDWIEIPQYGADGDVIEISLHTVKIQNWDKTITTVPTHALISESFKNWRGMQEAGGRRIKRALYIDMTSIRFCDAEMLERFRKIQYIQSYIDERIAEINAYNKANAVDLSTIVNGRHMTNIGTFRAYAQRYLENHPHIHRGMVRMVRQLEPAERGLPLEIYVFTDSTVWTDYEAIQADIFDHLLAVIPAFDLRIFQNPGGYDLHRRNSL